MKYRPRVIDKSIEKRLESKGAIVVEGAKWCGKTTTCERHASSVLYLGNTDDQLTQLIKLADISPRILLQGKTPRLIDEWQLAPTLWDAARFEIEHREGFGHNSYLPVQLLLKAETQFTIQEQVVLHG